jgi:hypothetical protein
MLIWLTLLLGCSPDDAEPGQSGAHTTEPVADPAGIVGREDGWLRGDLHLHTDYDGGFESVQTVIALAEYLASDTFVDAHPEYAGNALDFLSITDHRMVEHQDDPGYRSDTLILVDGEEFGSSSHAGAHGVTERVDHDPDGDGVDLDDIFAAVEHAHDQGGTFSPNHPFLPDLGFPWDGDGYDGIEVWNSGWGLMAPPYTPADLDAWEAENGQASPTFKRALQVQTSSADQGLVWYEAQLARGLHRALIAGSDRHAVLLPGFPTTWVRADGDDQQAILDGIRSRRTFLSRTPASAQIVVSVDGQWGIGDQVPISTEGGSVEVVVDVGRADGGRVRIIAGAAVASDEALEAATLGEVVLEEPVSGPAHQVRIQLDVVPGDWFYVVVHEPLQLPGASPEQAASVLALAEASASTGAEDFLGLANILGALANPDVIFNASRCDATLWDPAMLQCFPPDDEALGSFFVPEHLDRALNVITDQGAVGEWSMGAVASAVMFVAD